MKSVQKNTGALFFIMSSQILCAKSARETLPVTFRFSSESRGVINHSKKSFTPLDTQRLLNVVSTSIKRSNVKATSCSGWVMTYYYYSNYFSNI